MKHYLLDEHGLITYFADEGEVCKVRRDTQTIARLLSLRIDNHDAPKFVEAAIETAGMIADQLSDGKEPSGYDYNSKLIEISKTNGEWVINPSSPEGIRSGNGFHVMNDIPIMVIQYFINYWDQINDNEGEHG